MCGLGRPGRLRLLRSSNSPVRVVTYCFDRLLILIDGLRFGLGNPHLLSGKMPSMPFPGSWQVRNGRLFLATTEVPPSSDWCSKEEIQAVAATIQRWFLRRQNRTQFDL